MARAGRSMQPDANEGDDASSADERPAHHREVPRIAGKTEGYTLAKAELDPAERHAALCHAASGTVFKGARGSYSDAVAAITDAIDGAADDLTAARRLLTAQALTLDQVFTMMMARSFKNLADYPDAAERYARLAYKAQAQSRATIEALGKLVRGGEQIVRHVHVDNRGGQAVITEAVHAGGGNAGSAEQPHAREVPISALCSPDPFGFSVPVPGNAERAMQDARRPVDGRSKG